ncbi:MAG TPA: WD40 repeat domain-containing protein [Steroidobacteraceae bacterium]|nr:WD40 repeat domain-containing protein [Steroidobacteraceae bacterium]
MKFAPDSSRAIAIGRDVSIWDLSTGKAIVRALPLSHAVHANWSPSGHLVCIKSTVGALVIADSSNLQVVAQLQSKKAGQGCDAVFSRDGGHVLDGTWNGLLAVYDVLTSQRQREHHFPKCTLTTIKSSPSYARAAFVIQPKVAAGLGSGPQNKLCVVEWSAAGLALRELPRKWNKIVAIAFDPEEVSLAVLSHNLYPKASLEIVEIESGELISSRDCVLHAGGSEIDWSPDGQTLAVVEKGGINFYERETMRPVAREEFHLPYHVAFSPDGKWIALGASNTGIIKPTVDVLEA